LHNLKVGTNGGTQFIDLTIQSIEKPEALKGTIILLFTDLESSSKQIITKIKNDPQILSNRESELESELQQAKEELEIIRTDMQNTREKLQLSNEEMLSTNEELQATNEELQTVNDELESKISEFLIAKNDINNLLNNTDIAILFLDKHLNIRRFTDSLIKIFKIRESDIGRPFTDMVTDLQYPGLSDDSKQVLGTLMIKEMDINTNDQRWFKVRLMPYRTFDDNIDGLVITFIDISKAKLLETQLALINNNERGKRESDLIIANKEVLIQFQEKEKIIEELNRAIELLKANNLYKQKE
jgi:two-component system CheB/CheR fusion protein